MCEIYTEFISKMQRLIVHPDKKQTKNAHLKHNRLPSLKIEHGIVPHFDDELGVSLSDGGRDLKGSIVADQGEREHAVLASVVVIHLRNVRVVERQRCALRGVLI